MYRVGAVLETACGVGEFRCRDGTCIGNSSRCNQFVDCEDASDEMNCSEWYPLPEPSLGPARLLPLSCPAFLSTSPLGPQGCHRPLLTACLSHSCSLSPGLGSPGVQGEGSEWKVWTTPHLKDTVQFSKTHEGPNGPVVAWEGDGREPDVSPHPCPHQVLPTAAATSAWG